MFGTPIPWDIIDGFVFSVVLHEIGHSLGLAHNGELDSIMNVSLPRSSVFTGLDADDIEGIQAIYGAPSPVPLPGGIWLFGSALMLLVLKR